LKDLPYLDIHTHCRADASENINVECLSVEELHQEKKARDYTSAGVHPWWLEDYTTIEIEKFQSHVQKLAEDGKLWAIGETGIDRMYPEFLEQQKKLFSWHFELAEKYHLPLVIHNVRAGSDFLEILKKNRPSTAWIFHDYRGNEELMKDLMRLHPQCYFSFGLSLDNSQQIRELLPHVPLTNLFLETDAQKHLDIQDIYIRASEQLKMDVSFLKSQIWFNFRKISPLPQ